MRVATGPNNIANKDTRVHDVLTARHPQCKGAFHKGCYHKVFWLHIGAERKHDKCSYSSGYMGFVKGTYL